MTDLFPLHPGDLVNIRLDGGGVQPAKVFAVLDDGEPGDPSYLFAFPARGWLRLTEGFTAEQVAERVTRAEP